MMPNSSMNDSSQMYKEQILDLYRNPIHFGVLDHHTHAGHKHNASCGDELTVQLQIVDNKIVDAKFTGSGCAISTASACLFTDAIIGKSVDDAKKITGADVIKLLGVDISASRINCVTLSMDCFKKAIGELK